MSMMLGLLQLSVCIVAVIQLTSSQPTVTNYQRENDVGSCYALNEANEARLSEMQDGISRLVTAMTQLQAEVTELKEVKPAENATGDS